VWPPGPTAGTSVPTESADVARKLGVSRRVAESQPRRSPPEVVGGHDDDRDDEHDPDRAPRAVVEQPRTPSFLCGFAPVVNAVSPQSIPSTPTAQTQ
jgi:hypothetical protein